MLTQWVAAAPLKAALALLAVLVAARTGVFIHSIRAYREKTKADRCLAPRTFLSLPAGSAPVRRLEFFKINDEVMGGRSTSSVTAKGGDVTFSGVINTNGGGFASFRTLGARSAGSDDEAPLGLPADAPRSRWRPPGTAGGARRPSTSPTAGRCRCRSGAPTL